MLNSLGCDSRFIQSENAHRATWLSIELQSNTVWKSRFWPNAPRELVDSFESMRQTLRLGIQYTSFFHEPRFRRPICHPRWLTPWKNELATRRARGSSRIQLVLFFNNEMGDFQPCTWDELLPRPSEVCSIANLISSWQTHGFRSNDPNYSRRIGVASPPYFMSSITRRRSVWWRIPQVITLFKFFKPVAECLSLWHHG